MSDELSRRKIVECLTDNLLVEAAAGTGKTTSMVDRMVKLIATGHCSIEHLAAVTFTRKAAAELQERFREAMSRAIEIGREGSRDSAEVERLRLAMPKVTHAFVGTFHSFCSMLLRERPIEFEVDPGFREIAEAESQAMMKLSWRQFVEDMTSASDSRLQTMQQLGLSAGLIQGCFFQFVQHSDIVDWPAESPQPIDLQQVKQCLEDYLKHIETRLSMIDLMGNKDRLAERFQEFHRKAAYLDWDSNDEVMEFLSGFDRQHGCTQNRWPDKKLAKAEIAKWDEFRQEIVLPTLQWWHRVRYAFLIPLLRQADNAYRCLRNRSGGLDYQDLLLKVAAGLKNDPILREYFAGRFTHILVDEFQDTDPIQAEILAYLASTDQRETRWQACRLRPGSLFVVGDPKQSIYRFRRADIVVYQQIRKLILDSGGQVVPLSKNFRSLKGVRKWINQSFRSRFPAEENCFSPIYVGLDPGRDVEVGTCLADVRKLNIPPAIDQPLEIAEAEAIADYIQYCLDSGKLVTKKQAPDVEVQRAVRPGDFLVLTRTRRHLSTFAKVLNERRIECEVSGGSSFSNIEQLSMLRDCLRAIDDASNPLHYVSLARGHLFGISDQQLYVFKQAGGSFNYSAPLPEGLDESLSKVFEKLNGRLLAYRQWLRNWPFAAAIGEIATDLGLILQCATQRDGNIVAGDFLKAIELLRQQSHQFDSALDAISFLDSVLDGLESDNYPVMPGFENRVRLMTVHRAKGLQAPVVILADVGKQKEFQPSLHVDRTAEQPRGYLSLSQESQGRRSSQRTIAEPIGWPEFCRREKEFENAEDVRLLYVGCTRAESQLVICYQDRSKGFWSPLFAELNDCQELSVARIEPPASKNEQPPTERSSQAENSRIQIDIQQRWIQKQVPSYVKRQLKEESLRETRGKPGWRTSGDYGMDWGSAVHSLMETMMRRPEANLVTLAARACVHYELEQSRADELVELVQQVRQSSLWQRAMRSECCYVEVPVDAVESNDVLVMHRGVIDLLFKQEDGWVIVDYKTDDLSEDNLATAVRRYRPQIESYAKYWEQISDEFVVERGLYFTRVDSYQRV